MKLRLFFIITGISGNLCCTGCSKSKDVDPPVIPEIPQTPASSIPSTGYDITLLNECNLFSLYPQTVNFQRQDYNELSGIAASITNPGILYMHDDKKNAPVIITNAEGEDLGIIILDGISTINPEDISIGPGPEADKSYIYFADIGNNNFDRLSMAVYRFEEPIINNPTAQTILHISNAEKITLKYPVASYNAETILVDPLTKDIYIASKENNRSILYKAAYPQSTTALTIMTAVLKMPFDLLTSGDISADGKEILLRDKGQIWYWKRNTGMSLEEVLKSAPEMAPYAGNEHQGEGIGFAADGSGYYTNTEIKKYPEATSQLSFYKRK